MLLHDGGLFGPPQPTGQRLALEGLQWLPPCEPGQIVGLWNNFRAAADKVADGDFPENTEAGGLWDSVQMNFGGRHYFLRLGFNF